MKTVRMRLGEPDETGRKKPLPIAGSEFETEFDRIFLGLGETPDISFLPGEVPQSDGKVQVDAQGFTRVPKIYSGGDVVTGPAFVSKAMGMGKTSGPRRSSAPAESPFPACPQYQGDPSQGHERGLFRSLQTNGSSSPAPGPRPARGSPK